MIKNNLDELDIEILKCLQKNSNISTQELSEEINLSKTASWSRVKNLYSLGYIKKAIAILNPEKLGLDVRVIITLQISSHNLEWLDYFSNKITSMHNIVRFYRLSGKEDYFLELLLKDLKDYDKCYRYLLTIDNIDKITSMMVLEEIVEYGVISGEKVKESNLPLDSQLPKHRV